MGPSWLKSEKFTVLTRVLKGLQLSTPPPLMPNRPAPIEFYYLIVGCKPNIGLGESVKLCGIKDTLLLIKSFE